MPFLRPDGRDIVDTGLSVMLGHLDHMLEIMGPDHVGIGFDFDGAWIPRAIGDASGLPALQSAMQVHGYSAGLIEKISHGNWLRVLEATWGR